MFDLFRQRNILEHVKEAGAYLEQKLEQLKAEYPCIRARRGIGLLQGLELDSAVTAGEISNKALAQGLILITAGNNVLRFVPPLVIEKEHVDEMVQKLKMAL